jgi:hypothetical protein
MWRPGALRLGDVHVDGADVAELLDRLLRVLERLAVLALLVGGLARPVALDRPGDDHRGAAGGRLRLREGAVDGRGVVTIDLDRVPVACPGPVGV